LVVHCFFDHRLQFIDQVAYNSSNCSASVPSAPPNLQAGVHIFVEKPLSVKPVEEVKRLAKELKAVQQENGVIVAVGYMLRYSPAVEVLRPPCSTS